MMYAQTADQSMTMEGTNERNQVTMKKEEDEAEVEIWNYVFGFANMAVVKCAIDMGIAEAIQKNNGNPMTLAELSSSLNCDPSLLRRVMRFLTHLKFFKQQPAGSTVAFQLTPLSRRLIRHGGEDSDSSSMAGFILFETTPVMLAPWLNLSERVSSSLANGTPPFEKVHGKDVWRYAADDATHSKLITDAMACDTSLSVPAIIEGCPEVFDGIETLVDVGGNDGAALRALMKGLPWIIRGITFDLPHVVAAAAADANNGSLEHVGGDMFDSVPKADAALIKWVLHDWGDKECIQILKNCREAIPKDKGKVIIVEAIIGDEEEEEDDDKHWKFKSVGLMLDMVMMAHTNNGKERTLKEWDFVLHQAGFGRYDVVSLHAVQSLIVAFP